MQTQCTGCQSQRIPGVSFMVLEASSFSESMSDDPDPSEEELEDDPEDEDDSDDNLERDCLQFSLSLVI